MTSIALSRLLRPLLWLLWLVLLALVLPILLGAITPFLLLAWVVGLILMIGSRAFRERMGVTVLGYLLWLLLWPILLVGMMVPALALGLAAVLHLYGQVPPDLLQLVPQPKIALQDWALFAVCAGTIAFSSNCVYLFLDVPWRLKQIRQIRALPRSKTRSAAVGLSEFVGLVRAAGSDGVVSKTSPPEVRPFYLEDETGRILVDPRGATVRARSVSGVSLQLNEVEAGIREGDRVYVIGYVHPGADGANAPVVRPLRQSLVRSPIARLLLAPGRQMSDREDPNIFIVDKGREQSVILRLRMALWDLCVISAAYLAASLWLVQAAWSLLTPAK